MTGQQDSTSGKNHRTENFPVASVMIAKLHRGAILAFYRFARVAYVIADLGGDRASAPLMRTIAQLTTQVSALLVRSSHLAPLVADIRLRMEIATIQRLAERLTERLIRGDPLADDVHLGKPAMLMLMLSAAAGQAAKSLLNPRRSKLERGVRNS